MGINIKMCKGLENKFLTSNCCIICKRRDPNQEKTLVKELSVDTDTKTEHCIHYLSSRASVKRKK